MWPNFPEQKAWAYKRISCYGKKKRKTKKVKNPSEFRKQEMKKVTFSAGM